MLRRRSRHRNTDRAPLTRILRVALVALSVVSAVGIGACGSSETTTPGEGVVVSVFDGDTVAVRIDGRNETVRLIGIDTPETVHPTKPVQCFGPEASAFTTSLLPEGTRVRIVRDAEARDAYDRLLAYVHVVSEQGNDVFVNLELVRLGYARPYPFPPNTTHSDDFTQAAWEARNAGRGLWVACQQ